MCTVSWRLDADGYEVLFNRDELRTRSQGLPPLRQQAADNTFLAPVDPDGGGTWVTANQAGITLCLVNGYRDSTPPSDIDWRSRGRLMTDLGGIEDLSGVGPALHRQVGEHAYRSFRLLAFAAGADPRGWRWSGISGGQVDEFDPLPPITSSSLDAEGAARLRSKLFSALPTPPTSADLLALHQHHPDGPSALTPCMHRQGARTVSLTRVQVSVESVTMEYAPGPPCTTPLGEPLTVERIGRVASAE